MIFLTENYSQYANPELQLIPISSFIVVFKKLRAFQCVFLRLKNNFTLGIPNYNRE